MADKDAITFPSADSFDIRLDGFVEWSMDPRNLPLIYVQYGEGGELVPYSWKRKVILPYAAEFLPARGNRNKSPAILSAATRS